MKAVLGKFAGSIIIFGVLALILWGKDPKASPTYTPTMEQKRFCIEKCLAVDGMPHTEKLMCTCKFLYSKGGSK